MNKLMSPPLFSRLWASLLFWFNFLSRAGVRFYAQVLGTSAYSARRERRVPSDPPYGINPYPTNVENRVSS